MLKIKRLATIGFGDATISEKHEEFVQCGF